VVGDVVDLIQHAIAGWGLTLRLILILAVLAMLGSAVPVLSALLTR
jgi:hypothetical protein